MNLPRHLLRVDNPRKRTTPAPILDRHLHLASNLQQIALRIVRQSERTTGALHHLLLFRLFRGPAESPLLRLNQPFLARGVEERQGGHDGDVNEEVGARPYYQRAGEGEYYEWCGDVGEGELRYEHAEDVVELFVRAGGPFVVCAEEEGADVSAEVFGGGLCERGGDEG